MAETLSDAFARRVIPTATTQFISDSKKTNLQLIVTPAGARYWSFYKKWQGKPVELSSQTSMRCHIRLPSKPLRRVPSTASGR